MATRRSALLPVPMPELTPLLLLGAAEVQKRSSVLGAQIPKGRMRHVIAELLGRASAWASARIEGSRTTPVEVEQAARGSFSIVEAVRDGQLEAVALSRCYGELDAETLGWERITSVPFALDCHRWFFEALPEHLRFTRLTDGTKVQILPGELRNGAVMVGRHVAPGSEQLETLLAEWSAAYAPLHDPVVRIVAAFAGHARYEWIHPFLDGNGRAGRLWMHAALSTAVDGASLWSMSRGIVRHHADYYRALESAGDGAAEGLGTCVGWMIEVALEELAYMEAALAFPGLSAGMGRAAEEHGLSAREAKVVEAAWRNGGVIDRSEAARILGVQERRARILLNAIVESGWLALPSPKARRLQVAIPAGAGHLAIPGIYPS